MQSITFFFRKYSIAIMLVLPLMMLGCASLDPKPAGTPVYWDVPKEGAKSSLPHYFIEAPDIVSIEAVHLVPKSPYQLRAMDAIALSVTGTLPEEPDLSGTYVLDPGGFVQLGVYYGAVRVGGFTIENAEKEIEKHLKKRIKTPKVAGKLVQMSEIQQIIGNHIVEPDGNITLGSYGQVYIQGLTIPECKEAVEMHLTKMLENPIVAVEIFSFNSKEYYVVLQGGGTGDKVYSFPYTGNETVLKAIANVNGLQTFSSKRMWVARPNGNSNKPVILPVDWNAVIAYGAPQTNYQLLPGDRVFICEDKMVRADNFIAKTVAPFERVMGFMMLGASTASRYTGNVLAGGGEQGRNF